MSQICMHSRKARLGRRFGTQLGVHARQLGRGSVDLYIGAPGVGYAHWQGELSQLQVWADPEHK
jgi:hypothetical protein